MITDFDRKMFKGMLTTNQLPIKTGEIMSEAIEKLIKVADEHGINKSQFITIALCGAINAIRDPDFDFSEFHDSANAEIKKALEDTVETVRQEFKSAIKELKNLAEEYGLPKKESVYDALETAMYTLRNENGYEKLMTAPGLYICGLGRMFGRPSKEEVRTGEYGVKAYGIIKKTAEKVNDIVEKDGSSEKAVGMFFGYVITLMYCDETRADISIGNIHVEFKTVWEDD